MGATGEERRGTGARKGPGNLGDSMYYIIAIILSHPGWIDLREPEGGLNQGISKDPR